MITQMMMAAGGSGANRIYNTLNPLDKHTTVTLSNGNLTASISSTGMVRGLQQKLDAYSWSFETTIVSGTVSAGITNIDAALNTWVGQNTSSSGIRSDGLVSYLDSFYFYNGITASAGSIIGIRFTSGQVYGAPGSMQYFINGNYICGIGGVLPYRNPWCYAAVSSYGSPCVVTCNFGATPFTYLSNSGSEGWWV